MSNSKDVISTSSLNMIENLKYRFEKLSPLKDSLDWKFIEQKLKSSPEKLLILEKAFLQSYKHL
ncbi:MAG: hypothetical protein SNJ77_09015, partial [Cytophagales bacterium]